MVLFHFTRTSFIQEGGK